MTVEEMIAERTGKLEAIKDSSNAAVIAKGGSAADDLSGLPAAISSIPSGGGGAKEPYIEETYDESGNLIGANLVGYTAVRDNAFSNCTSLALANLPSGLTSIGDSAFQNCGNLALTTLPNGLTNIGNKAFQNCGNLALTTLPNGLTSIGGSAFQNCVSLTFTVLPSGLTSIGDYAFYNCTKLTSITFQGKPNSISSSAFDRCTKLKTINVPWASGEVANAPWGATNATINYNYTG